MQRRSSNPGSRQGRWPVALGRPSPQSRYVRPESRGRARTWRNPRPSAPYPCADKAQRRPPYKAVAAALPHGSLSLARLPLPAPCALPCTAPGWCGGCAHHHLTKGRSRPPTTPHSSARRRDLIDRMAAPSSLASSHLSRLADLRRAAAFAPAPAPQQQQLRLGCSRRRAQRLVAMAGSGKFFVGGNWKCNGTKESISKLVSDLNAATLENDVDVVVAPPFIYIDQVKNSLTDRIEVSAQNTWIGKGGAFTGEISAEQLVDIGCKWVILGHSERRHVIGEDDQFIGKKAAYALSQNLKVMACIGELLEEREAGKTFDVCFKQMKAFADNITNWTDVVIAYEPVWAIGTGKVASPEQAQEVHAAVRDWLKTNVSPDVASTIRIIYGGSVNAANCAELAKKQDIDGFLVGGASLKGPDFATIVNSVTSKKVAA